MMNLAKKLGDFDILDALKEKIFSNIQEGYDKRIEQELNEQIFDRIDSQEKILKYRIP